MQKQKNIIIFSLFAGILVTLILGYNFGSGNQVDQLPLIYRVLDSSYLKNDFIINVNSQFGPRFFFVALIALLSHLTNVPIIYLLLTFLANILIAYATGLMANFLFKDSKKAAFWAIAIVMSFEGFTLGGAAEIRSSILTPQLLAIPFAFISIYFFLKEKLLISIILVGVSSLIHPQVGLETGFLLILTAFCLNFHKKKVLIIPTLIFLLFSIVWLPFLLSQNGVLTEQIKILAYFRAPHHYLPSKWPLKEYLDFVGFMTAGIIAWKIWLISCKNSQFVKSTIINLVVLILLLCLGGYLFVEKIPTGLFLSLQPFRLLLLVKWLGMIFVSGYLVNLIENKSVNSKDLYFFLISVLNPLTTGLVFLVTGIKARIVKICTFLFTLIYLFHISNPDPRNDLLYVILIFLVIIFEEKKLLRLSTVGFLIVLFALIRFKPQIQQISNNSPEAQAENYIVQKTPVNSVFLIPPVFEQFRLVAKRAVVVDYKVDPYADLARVEWYKRITDIYGNDPLNFEDYYKNNTNDTKLKNYNLNYGISYAVLYNETASNFSVLFENTKYKLVLVK